MGAVPRVHEHQCGQGVSQNCWATIPVPDTAGDAPYTSAPSRLGSGMVRRRRGRRWWRCRRRLAGAAALVVPFVAVVAVAPRAGAQTPDTCAPPPGTSIAGVAVRQCLAQTGVDATGIT